MLSQLAEYERRQADDDGAEEQLPASYKRDQVMGLIDLDSQGNLLAFVTLARKEGKRRQGKEMGVPYRLRTSDADSKPLLLADRAEFVLAVPPADPSKARRIPERHRRFIKLVRECADQTKDPGAMAVLRFLEGGAWKGRELPDGFSPGDLVTFRVDGKYAIESDSLRRFWAAYLVEARDTEAGHRAKRRSRRAGETPPPLGAIWGQCLVCGGQDMPIARLHEVKIKGIPGGQAAGTALVSFNTPAFEHYGLTQAYNAPVCQECADTYARGLNRLLRGDDTSLRVEEVAYAFWTRERQPFSVAQLLANPQPDEVKALLESPWKAEKAVPLQAKAFYAAAFTASGGRAVVRDWIESTLPEVQENLKRYFLRQRIVPLFGEEPRLFRIRDLVRSLAPDRPGRGRAESREPPQAATLLIHSALTGMPPPDWMLFLAVRRNRAEQGPVTRIRQGRVLTWARAALIKLLLQSQTRDLEPNKEGKMDTATQQSPAYLCGRLLALLEQAQSAAIPGAKATLVDRFYGSASSAPASVFGLLLRNAQPHLAKLRKENPGAHTNIQKGLEEVCSQIGQQFPQVLTLREQAVFALGYYYQRGARWTRRATPEASAPEPEKAQEPER